MKRFRDSIPAEKALKRSILPQKPRKLSLHVCRCRECRPDFHSHPDRLADRESWPLPGRRRRDLERLRLQDRRADLDFPHPCGSEFHGASPFRLWLTYFAGVAVTWTVGHIVTRHVFKQDVRIAVIAGISSAFANNIFIGLPLVGRSVGDEGLVALSILLAIHLPVMMIAGTILMENATHKAIGGEKRSTAAVFKQVGRNLVTNPLVIGLVIGLSTNVSGLALTPVLKTVVDQIASMAGPAALISLGMALTKYTIRGNMGIAVTMTFLNCCSCQPVSGPWAMYSG